MMFFLQNLLAAELLVYTIQPETKIPLFIIIASFLLQLSALTNIIHNSSINKYLQSDENKFLVRIPKHKTLVLRDKKCLKK